MMNACYAATIADLQGKADSILAMIAELKRLETVLAAPVPPAQSPQTPAAGTGAAPRKQSRRRVSSNAEKLKISPIVLVRSAISNLEEPFTAAEVRTWCEVQRKAHAKTIGKSSWFTAIYNLKTRGEIKEVHQGKNGKPAYVKAPEFGGLTPKEARYRKLRSEMGIEQPAE